MTRSAIPLITLAAALSVCSFHARAQQTLTLSSNLVQVGVVVSDSKGPVRGLKAEDFVVFDNGKPRNVRVLLEQSGEPVLKPAALTSSPSSNASTLAVDKVKQNEGRTTGTPTIILLDSLNSLHGSMPNGPYEQAPAWTEDMASENAKKRLIAALKQIDPRNPVAIYGLGLELNLLCDFNCSREQLIDSVKHYDATDKTSREIAEPDKITIPGQPEMSDAINRDNQHLAAELNGMRGLDTMAALHVIAARVTAIPGRKNLLWFTANLPFSGEAIARIVTPAKIAIYPVDARGLETWAFGSSRDGDRTTPSLAKGLDTYMANSAQPVGIEAMLEMAADTGGVAFVNTNDIAGAVRSVIDDPSATYTLGFYVDAASIDGKFHNLKIRVRTQNAQLRYARGYFALKAAAPPTRRVTLDYQSSKPAKMIYVTGQELLTAAIRSPLRATAVPLDVKLERDADHAVHLQGTVGVQGMSFVQNGAARDGGIVVYMVEQNAAGEVLNRSTHQMQLSLTDQQFADYVKSGVQFSESIHPQAETTVIRVIVRDAATSRIGSVILPLAKVE